MASNPTEQPSSSQQDKEEEKIMAKDSEDDMKNSKPDSEGRKRKK